MIKQIEQIKLNYLSLVFITANVVPPSLSATFDLRFANDVDLDEFNKTVKEIHHFSQIKQYSFVRKISFVLFKTRLTNGAKRLAVALN